jgi:hypothetical protein
MASNSNYAQAEMLRNADLPDLVALLKSQRARSVDLVAGADKISVTDGALVVAGAGVDLHDDGVVTRDGVYRPTRSFDAQLAKALGIDLRYLRNCREQRPDIYDANVNMWLHGSERGRHGDQEHAGMDRKWLLRLVRGDDPTADPGFDGVARAWLSDRFRRIDNFDVALAVVQGLSEARNGGAAPEVVSCELTEKRMYLRVADPSVRALAPELLKGYRTPFADGGPVRVGNGGWTLPQARAAAAREGQGYAPGDEPVLFAGFTVTNSDLGHGRYSFAPSIIVQICANGLTMNADVLAKHHLGGELAEGMLEWSSATHKANLELIKRQTVDAVAQFLSRDYVVAKRDELEKVAGVRVARPDETVKFVAQTLGFTDTAADDILAHFLLGGQRTSGGIGQAVSSVAQTVDDGDVQAEMERAVVPAMRLAAGRA